MVLVVLLSPPVNPMPPSTFFKASPEGYLIHLSHATDLDEKGPVQRRRILFRLARVNPFYHPSMNLLPNKAYPRSIINSRSFACRGV